MIRKKVSRFSSWLAGILALLLTAVMLLGLLSYLIHLTVFSDGLYRSTEKSVMTRQVRDVQTLVSELSETYGFAPEPILEMITEDALSEYATSVRAWARDLLMIEDPTLEMPTFYLPDLEQTIRSDEGFLNTVPSSQQRSVAQNDIGGAIEQKCQQMVFPMRSQLIALARNIAAEGISFAQILTILDFARYLLPAGLILMLMILALMHRDPLRVCGYYGASLASTGIVDLVCVFLIHTLHLSDKVKLVNTDYARVVSTFLRQLRSPFFWIGFLALLIGYAMIALLYHRFFKLQGAQVG